MELKLFQEEDFEKALQEEILPWRKKQVKSEFLSAKDGANLHYLYAIHPEEKGSIVISHGFCEFSGKYHEVMYYFYQQGYSVFLMEHRGHGFSAREVEEFDKVTITSYDCYVSDFAQFIEEIVKKKSVSKKLFLFAHSMGGTIGTLYMEEYKDTFEKAVLSAPMMEMNFRDVPNWAVKVLMVWSTIARWNLRYVPGQHGFDHIPVFETSSCLSKSRYDHVFAQREETKEYTSYGGTYQWTKASIKGIEKLHKNAKQIKTPILLFQAGLDGMVNPKGQDRFVEATSNTTFVRYEHSKHEIFNATTEIRKDYYQRIFEFLEN